MTEQEKANRFNAAVEQLLANGQVESESVADKDSALLELAQKVASHDTRSKSQVERSLRQTLLKHVSEREELFTVKGSKHGKTFSPRPLYRALSVVLALIAILIVVTLTVSPIRALAQEVIRQIGNFVITNEPTDAEQYVATLESGTPTLTPNPEREIPEEMIVGRLTVAQASDKAGFAVYAPAYLPEGYQLSTRDVLTTGQSTTISADYQIELDPPLHNGQQMRGIIAITQNDVYSGTQAWNQGVGDTPIVDVTVRGLPGVWVEQVPIYPFQDDQGKWDYARWNQLIWAEAGYTFMIQANIPADLLPLAELLKIAESLVP
jgi:hypothetical protein